MPTPHKAPATGGRVEVAPFSQEKPPVDDSDIVDYRLLRDYLGFVLRAPRRHKLLALLCFTAVASLGLSTLVLLPKTYRVQARILAQRNPIMSTLSNPYLPRPFDWDMPTRAARETVLRRDNLLELIAQTRFEERYLQRRAPAMLVRDWLVRNILKRERTHDDFIDALVDTLERKLTVEVGEGVVTITFDWSDGAVATRMVEAAVQNFLEVRHASEISMVTDAISILEAHAAEVKGQISGSLQQVEDIERSGRPRAAPPRRAAPPPPVASPPPGVTDEEMGKLQLTLRSKRRAIADLEEFRQRRLNELQGQLTQYQAIYADKHPAIVSVRQNIEAISGPSPQIEALRSEAQEVEREIVRRGGLLGAAPTRERPVPAPRTERVDVAQPPRNDNDPRIEYERGQLRALLNKYSNLIDRIDSARVELDTAHAAFKYRYSVITPPQLPKRPIKPSVPLVVVGSLLGGIAFALFACVAASLRSGLILERWQVERTLDLPVIEHFRK